MKTRNKKPHLHSLQCLSSSGFHRVAYREWGRRDNPNVLICAHGLARNGRDFDLLAAYFSNHFRVICPDVAGRGQSDWLVEPKDYALPVYAGDMVALIARLNVESVTWLGTSMGGLIGMALAACPRTPIKKLILNDVGPVVTAASIARIGQYVGIVQHFATIEEAEAYMRIVSAPFGHLDDRAWRRLTENVLRPVDGGGYTLAYDPNISQPYRELMDGQDLELWSTYDAIRCPTLVLRGEQSDLLTIETAQAMTQRGPFAKLVEVPGVGHAPMFQDASQIGLVEDFLLEG